MAYNGSRVFSGAGTLYAAPLGTAEPTAVTGVWPTGWVPLGFTVQGSQFSSQKQTADLLAEEEFYPLRIVTTGATASLAFELEEWTQQNLLLAQNAGIGTGVVSGASGTNPDGSLWVESPTIGTEVRVMLGWDYISEGGSTLPSGGTAGRLIVRQAFQTGNAQASHRKGATALSQSVEFSAEKPAGVNPFRFILPANLAS